jgi:ribosome maturation factor RimP
MDEKTIKDFVEKQIINKDIFLVDVSLKPGNVVHITVDKPEGISIDECVSLSRDFNSAFDRDEEDYDLQVSSPGLDSPLKVDQQFEKYRNKDVRVILRDGEKLKAELLDFNEKELKLMVTRKVREEGRKKKKLVNEEKIINRDKIKAVKAVISFK